MRHALAAAAFLLALTPLAPAQTLAHCVPADVLGYLRTENPMGALKKMAASPLMGGGGEQAIELMMEQIDEGLAMLAEMAGIEVGSLGTYLKSITSIEAVVFSVTLTDSFPDIDFALVITSPEADPLYKLASGILEQQQIGSVNEEGDTEIDIMGFYEAVMGHKLDRLVVSNNRERLREVLDGLGTVKGGSLAQAEHFKALTGGSEKGSCWYVRLEPVFQMIQELLPKRRMAAFNAFAGPLGLWKLAAVGSYDDGERTVFGIRGGETIPIFEIFAGSRGDTDIIARLPQRTIAAITWAGSMESLWRKGSALFLDPARFPNAAAATDAIRSFQETVGLKVEEIAAIVDRGVAIGFLDPAAVGAAQDAAFDGEKGVFGVIGLSDPTRAREAIDRLITTVGKRRGLEATFDEKDGVTWINLKKQDDEMSVAILDDAVVVGIAPVVAEVIAARRGASETVGKTGLLKGVGGNANGFGVVSMANLILAFQEHMGDSGAQQAEKLKPDAGVAVSLDFTKDSFTFRSTRSIGEVFTAIGTYFMAVGRVEATESGPQPPRRRPPGGDAPTPERPTSRPSGQESPPQEPPQESPTTRPGGDGR